VISRIQIRNFRCFQSIDIRNCRRINVIVGDNGSGKTSLLEAIFLTLSGNLHVSVALRAQRGIDNVFSGTFRNIEEAVWRDYFIARDWNNDIGIDLTGTGVEARSLRISRAPAQSAVTVGRSPQDATFTTSPLSFDWTDASGKKYSASPGFSSAGLRIPSTEEELLDFFHFGAAGAISSAETAARFSEIRQFRRDRKFVEAITREYDWIEDISIEISGGSPMLFATLKDLNVRIPLANVSDGINRTVSFLSVIASRDHSVLIIDEIEAGLYFKHQAGLWRSMLQFAREFDSQLFISTHSEEWLEALVDAAGDEHDDIALWRIERSASGPVVREFEGRLLKAGIETGGEVR
jgi:predicted ATPase